MTYTKTICEDYKQHVIRQHVDKKTELIDENARFTRYIVKVGEENTRLKQERPDSGKTWLGRLLL
jgi:hypothetical protein